MLGVKEIPKVQTIDLPKVKTIDLSENDKLIQMGIIRSPKYLALVARGDKVVNDKGKQRDDSEQSKEPSSSKRSKKNGKGKVLCSYCGRGFH